MKEKFGATLLELAKLIREMTRQKPIVVIKGGLSESGAGAASSHTGAMAGAGKIWRAAIKQSGAVMVDSLEEMGDVRGISSAIPFSNASQMVNLSARKRLCTSLTLKK